MQEVLCFRLFGPLAAWGYEEVGDALRPSQRHPARSAVLGLSAAALGICSDDQGGLEALGANLKVAVASHGRRRQVRELRTSQHGFDGVGSKRMTRKERLERNTNSKTALTFRENIEDGLWRVFLSCCGDTSLLGALEKALKRPRFALYLGRLEHPIALPVAPRIIHGGLSEALNDYDPVPPALPGDWGPLHTLSTQIQRRIVGNGVFDLRWDDGFPGAPQADSWRFVADDPYRRDAWSFRERKECQATIVPDAKPIDLKP